MGINHYHLMILSDLTDYIKKELYFKRYKILEYTKTGQISIFIPLKSHLIRQYIKADMTKYLPMTIDVFILELRWHQGWINKYKRIN